MWNKSKFRAIGSRDSDTGSWIPSKLEARVLARFRAEAWAQGWGVALHPQWRVEGGKAGADILLVRIPLDGTMREELVSGGWSPAWIRVIETKGRDLPAGRKARRQLAERYGLGIELVRK